MLISMSVAPVPMLDVVVRGLGLALTSGSPAVLHALTATPSRGAELLWLVTANPLATLLRFVLFRGWVFRPRSSPTPADGIPDVLEMETVR